MIFKSLPQLVKGFCGMGQQKGDSLGPGGAQTSVGPCTHPAASHRKWREGINSSTNFWKELPRPRNYLGTWQLMAGSRQKHKATRAQGLLLQASGLILLAGLRVWCQSVFWLSVTVIQQLSVCTATYRVDVPSTKSCKDFQASYGSPFLFLCKVPLFL